MRTRQCHSGSKREFQRGSNVVCERWAEEGQIMEGECSKCRAAIDEGRFCSNCGHPVEDAQAGSGDGEGEKNAAKRNETASSQERTLECLEALGRGEAKKAQVSKNAMFAVAAVVSCLVVMALGFSMCSGTSLKSVAREYKDEPFCTVAGDGSYLEIDTNPYDVDDYYSSGADNAIEDINKKLGLSDSVYRKMTGTRALDGVQAVEENGVRVRWTYHPDKGLEVIYEKA